MCKSRAEDLVRSTCSRIGECRLHIVGCKLGKLEQVGMTLSADRRQLETLAFPGTAWET